MALVFVVCGATGSSVSSCSSNEDNGPSEPADGGMETSSTSDAAASVDGETHDASTPGDAQPFDGGPLPVVCVASPCATSLVTTLGANSFDLAEGFCALLDDGTVACWGANGAGQLGRGEDAGMADGASAGRVVGLSGVVELDHTCALDGSGAVWCWGTGPFLRSDVVPISTEREPAALPLPPAKHIGVGSEVGCAEIDEGIICWGGNSNGQLASFDSESPFAVLPPRAIALPPGAPIRDLAIGNASFVLREDGALVSWGANPPLARVSSLFPDPHPIPITLGGITSMDLTNDNACATAGGVGYCWGALIPGPSSSAGASHTDRALPEPVVTREPVVQIATTRTIVTTSDFGDAVVQPQRWCAVGASGSVYCWGYNASGQAGDGTKDYAFHPIEVQGLPSAAVQVKTTPNATCALLTSGKVFCWGANHYGQLGNGKLKVPSLVPQEVVLP